MFSLETRCRRERVELMERRYRNDEKFHHVMTSLNRLTEEVAEEIRDEEEVTRCYSEHLDWIGARLSDLTISQISEKYSELKSELFSTSMAFFSSLSDHLKQYLKRVKARLQGLQPDAKRHLLNYMRDWWIEKAYPMIQAFVDKMDRVAKRLRVDSYSVSLDIAFISVSFTFKPEYGE